MFKKFNLFLKPELKVFLAQVILYLVLFFSQNNRTFFIPIILYVGYLFWLLEDWRQAVWLTLVAVLPFGWELRSWRQNLPLSFNFLFSGINPPFVSFSLTAKLIITFFLTLSLSFYKDKLKIKKTEIPLLFFLFMGLISTLRSSNLIISLISFTGISVAVFLYFLSRYFGQLRKIWRLTLYSILAIVLLEGILTFFQFWSKHPLGRIIEETNLSTPYVRVAAEDVLTFRASGTFTDPNTLAVFWLTVTPLVLVQILAPWPLLENKLIKFFFLFLCLIGLFATFSRGAWLIFIGITVALFFFLIKTKSLVMGKGYYKFFFVLGVIVIASLPYIWPRLASLHYSVWEKYSSGQTRWQLVKEAGEIIRQNPFGGCGPGNFIVEMSKNNLTGVGRSFPYPVHNLYLLLASELGIPALIFFLIFIFRLLQETAAVQSREKYGVKVGLIFGFVSFLLAVIVYTGIGINLELALVILGSLSSLADKGHKESREGSERA
jgi:O-antigen ligase